MASSADSKTKLTKAEIVDNMYRLFAEKGMDVNRRTVQSVVESFVEQVKSSLIAGRIVELRGFGTFELRQRKGRERARNPKTGAILPVANHTVAVFRPGKEIKESVWSFKD